MGWTGHGLLICTASLLDVFQIARLTADLKAFSSHQTPVARWTGAVANTSVGLKHHANIKLLAFPNIKSMQAADAIQS